MFSVYMSLKDLTIFLLTLWIFTSMWKIIEFKINYLNKPISVALSKTYTTPQWSRTSSQIFSSFSKDTSHTYWAVDSSLTLPFSSWQPLMYSLSFGFRVQDTPQKWNQTIGDLFCLASWLGVESSSFKQVSSRCWYSQLSYVVFAVE